MPLHKFENSAAEPADLISTENLTQQVLRIHPEPYRYFDDMTVHQMLTIEPINYLDHLLAMLESLATGESSLELPHKLVFDDADLFSDFRVMPCVIRHPERARKTVKLVGTNNRQQQVPDQITVGKAFAIDEKENFVSAGFAGCLLSSARTGACAATAARLLAKSAACISIIGAGRVGYYAAFYIAASGNTQQIHVCDIDQTRAINTAALLQQDYPEIKITASETRMLDADITVLATDSRDIIYGDEQKPDGLVISLGADTHWQHEISAQLLGQTKIYVDTLDSFNCGDLRRWKSENKINEANVIDLLSMLRDRPDSESPALFISTGSALFDNLTIDYLLENEKALAEKL